MDLTRLMRPRSIAVVGATPRAATDAHETLRHLAALGYDGEGWGVHPAHREVLGREVFPSLSDLPAPADAVVVAVPAAGVPDVIAEAGASGCGGAVVFGAGFADGGDRALQDRLVAAALRHTLPVIGPNCDGMVRLHERYYHRPPGSAKSQFMGDGLIACVLGNVYTDVEKTLIELERAPIVQDNRNAFQQAMEERFIGTVEQLSGREVVLFVSSHNVGPDLEVELFFFADPP